MQAWLTLLILVVTSRLIEVRQWRAGRLSDRAPTVPFLARFPVMVALSALVLGASPLFFLFVVAIALVPGALVYRWFMGIVEEQGRELGEVE